MGSYENNCSLERVICCILGRVFSEELMNEALVHGGCQIWQRSELSTNQSRQKSDVAVTLQTGGYYE